MRKVLFGVMAGLAIVAAQAASARPLTPAEQRFAHWQAVAPACDYPGVAEQISSRFSERESEYWSSRLTIAEFRDFHEIGFRSNGPDYIPRRYCSATAVTNDGKPRKLFYSIGEDLGFSGTDPLGSVFQSVTLGLLITQTYVSTATNYGVDWCIVGLDRNGAYGKDCHAAKP